MMTDIPTTQVLRTSKEVEVHQADCYLTGMPVSPEPDANASPPDERLTGFALTFSAERMLPRILSKPLSGMAIRLKDK